MRGSYVLLIRLDEGQTIAAGRLGEVYFPAGCYAYVGSARGGVEARVGRHLSKSKKRRWHIDYLLEKASVLGVRVWPDGVATECGIAQVLESSFGSVPGFGCSDCLCRSHLFFASEPTLFMEALNMAGE